MKTEMFRTVVGIVVLSGTISLGGVAQARQAVPDGADPSSSSNTGTAPGATDCTPSQNNSCLFDRGGVPAFEDGLCVCYLLAWVPRQVTNAEKGDVGLVPIAGNDSGDPVVRTALGSLGQAHRHSVMFYSNGTMIRHDTMYTDQIHVDEPAVGKVQLDAYELRNGTPGAISQSIDDAFANGSLVEEGLLLKPGLNYVNILTGVETNFRKMFKDAVDTAIATPAYYKLSDYTDMTSMLLPFSGKGDNLERESLLGVYLVGFRSGGARHHAGQVRRGDPPRGGLSDSRRGRGYRQRFPRRRERSGDVCHSHLQAQRRREHRQPGGQLLRRAGLRQHRPGLGHARPRRRPRLFPRQSPPFQVHALRLQDVRLERRCAFGGPGRESNPGPPPAPSRMSKRRLSPAATTPRPRASRAGNGRSPCGRKRRQRRPWNGGRGQSQSSRRLSPCWHWRCFVEAPHVGARPASRPRRRWRARQVAESAPCRRRRRRPIEPPWRATQAPRQARPRSRFARRTSSRRSTSSPRPLAWTRRCWSACG